jgi:tetratricopeptide (TPR) repeat protein
MIAASRMNARTHRTAWVVLAVALLASTASAQGGSATAHGQETPPDVAARARQHFQKGRELYQAGAYREAIGELEAAHSLDPRAKDLVYNLAIVNEKLGQIDGAIQYLHVYLEMELEAQERVHAEATLKRLEGSKKEVVVAPISLPPTTGSTPPETATPPPPPPNGRIDAATVAVGGTAVAGVAVGVIFGIKALGDRPTNVVSGKDGQNPQTLAADQSHAHTEGIIADVGFGVGVAAAAITAYLYFGRPKAAAHPRPENTVSVTPVVSGGHGAVLLLGGTF